MFIQGYGIGFIRDPRVAGHSDPNTRSSVNVCAQLDPSGSFNIPHIGGKLTEMTYLSTRRHDRRYELSYSPPLYFSIPHTQYCIFWKFLGQKIFFVHFELYCTELEFWILTPKNEKKYFFRYPLPNILNFLKIFGSKNFFESFWT